MDFAKARQITQAIECFRRAIAIDASIFAAHANLGTLLAERGEVETAMIELELASQLNPSSSQVHNNLANVLTSIGRLDDAVAHCRRSLELRPENAEAYNALGNALKDQGLLDEAIASYAEAARLRPDLPQPASNYLYALHFREVQSRQVILAAHRDWNNRFARHFKSSQRPHQNARDALRRLKIGYVSPDFREHPVGRFILPLIQAHDRTRFEIFCYANLQAADSMSDRLRESAYVWRDIAALSDDEACELIRADAIDILVDLTVHMRASRLLVFARKPAPVQVTYLAYCSTTGLEAIDYRFTDAFLDPPEKEEGYVERSIRLPETYWCYQANLNAPEVNPLPAIENKSITFACLNNFCKITSPTLEAWAQLLQIVPNSRLILHTSEGTHRERAREKLRADPRRLGFVERLPMPNYFERYHGIDIALDPFPCTGGTTTCDALWMGVPVVSLAGETAVSRGGLSILSNIGHAEWVATTVDSYVKIATGFASDLERLGSIRGRLRGEMRRSPLMDQPRFVRNVENSYREMWRDWCNGRENPGGAGG